MLNGVGKGTWTTTYLGIKITYSLVGMVQFLSFPLSGMYKSVYVQSQTNSLIKEEFEAQIHSSYPVGEPMKRGHWEARGVFCHSAGLGFGSVK